MLTEVVGGWSPYQSVEAGKGSRLSLRGYVDIHFGYMR